MFRKALWIGMLCAALGAAMHAAACAKGAKETVHNLLPVVLTDNVERLKAFYRDVVGLPVQSDEGNFIQFGAGKSSLAIMYRGVVGRIAGERGAIVPSDKGFRCELYFVVEDAEAASSRLKKAGAPVISPLAPRPWGQRVAYFLDPDENLIAVADSKK